VIPNIIALIVSGYIGFQVKLRFRLLAFAIIYCFLIVPISYIYLGTIEYINKVTGVKLLEDINYILLGLFKQSYNLISGQNTNYTFAVPGLIVITSFVMGTLYLIHSYRQDQRKIYVAENSRAFC
jgi:hypothetical protein